MDVIVSVNDHGSVSDRSGDTDSLRELSSGKMKFDHLFAELSERARRDLADYLELAGLSDEAKILVIPYSRHFYYEAEEISGVNAIVNLKQLNYVREIRNFLHKVAEMMPLNSTFVGCFIDNSSRNGFSDKYSNLPRHLSEKAEAYENGIESRIPFINRMYSFIDAKTDRYLTKKTVARLIEECGLQLIGMTELNGLTYFHSKKRTSQIGLIA